MVGGQSSCDSNDIHCLKKTKLNEEHKLYVVTLSDTRKIIKRAQFNDNLNEAEVPAAECPLQWWKTNESKVSQGGGMCEIIFGHSMLKQSSFHRLGC